MSPYTTPSAVSERTARRLPVGCVSTWCRCGTAAWNPVGPPVGCVPVGWLAPRFDAVGEPAVPWGAGGEFAAPGAGSAGEAAAGCPGAVLGACPLEPELCAAAVLGGGAAGASVVLRDCLPIRGADSASVGGGSPTLSSARLDSRDIYELRGNPASVAMGSGADERSRHNAKMGRGTTSATRL